MAELKDLHCFAAVADTGTLSRAAREVHVAQPALSRRIRALERELGVELLTRHAKGHAHACRRGLRPGSGNCCRTSPRRWAWTRPRWGAVDVVLAATMVRSRAVSNRPTGPRRRLSRYRRCYPGFRQPGRRTRSPMAGRTRRRR
jgi:hypothetical protein